MSQDGKERRLSKKKIYYTPENPGAFAGPEKTLPSCKKGGKI